MFPYIAAAIGVCANTNLPICLKLLLTTIFMFHDSNIYIIKALHQNKNTAFDSRVDNNS